MISAGLVTHKGTLPIFFYDPCLREEGFRLDTKKNIFNLNILKQRQQSGSLLRVGLALTAAVLESRWGKTFHHYVFSLWSLGTFLPLSREANIAPEKANTFLKVTQFSNIIVIYVLALDSFQEGFKETYLVNKRWLKQNLAFKIPSSVDSHKQG